MKRSEINRALRGMEVMLEQHRFALPPFCHYIRLSKKSVIARQSADWRSAPSFLTDSHGSDIGHCLGMTVFSLMKRYWE